MNIPFLDLKAQYLALKDDIDAAIGAVLQKTAFAGGPFVEAFEEAFAAFCQSRYAAGVGNGTDALWLAMRAIGIGPGDEVITTANTFIATAEAISLCGAVPMFVDVCEDSYNMDPSKIEGAITPRTRAIIPVHLFGQMADMDPILEIARRHHLVVIEDASQAHGATYQGRRAGSLGMVGCFSFYPGKNLGAYGEAGGVVSNDETIIRTIKRLRDHGQEKKYHHSEIGWNARMDGIQGAILSVKLNHLERGNALRRAHAALYDRQLAGVPGVVTPRAMPYGEHVYHVYAIRTPARDAVMNELTQRGIGSNIHYPVPLHLQKAYAGLGWHEGAFPVSERCAREFLSLPMYPELSDTQLSTVADAIRTLRTGG